MATDNVTIGTTYTKVVDSAVTTFTLSSVEPFTWEVLLSASTADENTTGHRVKDSDLQVTRMIGAGHVFARAVDNPMTLVRSQG